jgi:hypothetical protein
MRRVAALVPTPMLLTSMSLCARKRKRQSNYKNKWHLQSGLSILFPFFNIFSASRVLSTKH